MDQHENAPILEYRSKLEPVGSGIGSFVIAYLASSVLVGVPTGMFLLMWKLGNLFSGEDFIAAMMWLVVTAVALVVRILSRSTSRGWDVLRAIVIGSCSWVVVFALFYLLVIIEGQYKVRGWP